MMTSILVIGARGIPDVEGGAEKHAECLFPMFAAHGYSVTLLGVGDHVKSATFRGVHLRRIPTLRIVGTDKLIYHFAACIYAIVTRPDLVHLQGLNSGLFLFLYKLFGLKVVIRYGSADHEYAKWGLVGRLGFRLCEQQIKYADHVIAVSDKYKKDLQAKYGLKNVSVVPNGIDEGVVSAEADSYWRSLELQGVKYILAVGRLTADKDYDTLLNAVRALADKKILVVVAGGPDERGYGERLLAANEPRARFLGKVDRRLLSALYANCAVYVNSSLHEGLSNAILEAISFGCPIIASAIPANRAMALADQSYFAAGNADELQQRIEEAVAQPLQFIAPRGEFASWPQVFELTQTVYKVVLKN